MEQQNVRYAWYSPSMAKVSDIVVWRSVGDHNVLVHATLITDTVEHGCSWKDLVYVGMVTTYVKTLPRKGQLGTLLTESAGKGNILKVSRKRQP